MKLERKIDEKMARAHLVLAEIRKTIRENVGRYKNKDGLLTSELEDYLDCIQIDKHKLEELLTRDRQKWEKKIQVKKRKAYKKTEELQAFIVKQQAKLEAII